MKIRNVAIAMAIATAAASFGAAAQSDCSDFTVAPPAPLEEAMSLAPGPGYLWASGYWECQADTYQWVGGNWIREQPGYTWDPSHWEYRMGGHWELHRGHWSFDS